MASNPPRDVSTTGNEPYRYASTPSYSSAVSVPSTASTYLDYRSQTLSTRPSTQSSQLPASLSEPTAEATRDLPSRSGVLVVAIAGAPHARLKTYVETALRRDKSISSVMILGSERQQASVKLLKMDMYGLLGRIGREASVEAVLRSQWTSEEIRLRLAWGSELAVTGDEAHKELAGLICDLDGTMLGADVLDMDSATFEGGWRDSVGFVHAIASGVLASLKRASVEGYEQAVPGAGRQQAPFFALTMPSNDDAGFGFYTTATRSLLAQVAHNPSAAAIEFGYADQLLIPEPLAEPATKPPLLAPTDGWNEDGGSLSGGESPTKLWAAASQMGYF